MVRPGKTSPLIATLVAAWHCVNPAQGGNVSLRVTHDGAPVPGAVVSAHALGRESRAEPVEAVLDQIQSQFVPRQLVVPVGSRVRFPNSDITRHQVYSFSPAKRFELPLYSGTPPEPVVFETAGIVTLGCNIHDWMVGYVVVLDTPFFAESDAEGTATLAVPPGKYSLRVWHERLQGETNLEDITIEADSDAVTREVDIQLRPPPPPRGDERMRALQERFRNIKRD